MWGQGLLILQIGAAVVLLSAAAVLVRALNELRTTNAGFDATNVALMTLLAQPTGYTRTDVTSYLPELTRQLAEIPGVRSAALSIPEPIMGLSAGEARRRVTPASAAPGEAELSATMVVVSPGFFETLRIRFARGRDFAWRDRLETTPVCILSSSLATHLFPSTDAVGEHVRLSGDIDRHVEVIGIVADARLADLHESQPMMVFVPLLQQPPATVRSPTAVLRVETRLNQIAPEVAHRIEALGQDFAVRPRTLAQQADTSLLRERLLVLGGRYFGGVAALLVAIGLYGTLASNVARRTREIALRVALGAPQGALYGLVLTQTAYITGLGLAIGLPSAWLTTRVMRGALGGEMVAASTLVWLAVAVSVLGVAASWLPARRALAVAPIDALRHD
jgi:predicted permease